MYVKTALKSLQSLNKSPEFLFFLLNLCRGTCAFVQNTARYNVQDKRKKEQTAGVKTGKYSVSGGKQ